MAHIQSLVYQEYNSVRASKEGWETQTKDNITPGKDVNFTLTYKLKHKVFTNRDNDISLPDKTRIFIPKGALRSDTFLLIGFPDPNTIPRANGPQLTGIYREF